MSWKGLWEVGMIYVEVLGDFAEEKWMEFIRC